MQSSMDQLICDDLKAFERRLMEIISLQRPNTRRWRVILCLSSLLTSASAFYWLNDPKTAYISLYESLMTHYLFTINCIVLIALFTFDRTREVLSDFAMSCDESGRLILKPRQMKNSIEHLKI